MHQCGLKFVKEFKDHVLIRIFSFNSPGVRPHRAFRTMQIAYIGWFNGDKLWRQFPPAPKARQKKPVRQRQFRSIKYFSGCQSCFQYPE